MLSGFNTNIRHRGVLFHVQTEDSGRSHPHVITHLYYGGTILSSEKRGYEDLLGATDLPKEVKALMETQHKAMLKRLRAGEFDATIQARVPGLLADVTDTSSHTLREGPAPPASPAAKPPPPPAPDPSARAFGEGVISQKPLDEVVLDYLVESARKRKHNAP